MAANGTRTACHRRSNVAPPNRAIAVIGAKFIGWGSSRLAAAATTITARVVKRKVGIVVLSLAKAHPTAKIAQPCRADADDAEDDRRGFRYHRYTHEVVDREEGRGVHPVRAVVGRGEGESQALRPPRVIRLTVVQSLTSWSVLPR